MNPSLAPTFPRVSPATAGVPISILRTETVLSRFPMHNLTTGRTVTIHMTKTNAQGELDLHWAVSYNAYYGPPRHLAYKLDTIVINQILDALPRPLSQVVKLGSLRQIGTSLGVQVSGRQYTHLKNAFHQNASAYIVADLRYRGRDGLLHTLKRGFTRYSVLFTGETLPDGTRADAVHLVLSEPYLDILTHAPTRPLDYAYLKALTPTAQRFYEILSYKIYAALTRHHPHATLRYAEYCLLSTQQRYTRYDQVKKQMYKVHQPHMQGGYLSQVRYEVTRDAEGQPDWYMHYTPGPKAHTEFAAFTPRSGHTAAATRVTVEEDGQEDLGALVVSAQPATRPSPPRTSRVARDTATLPPAASDPSVAQAQTLVAAFYQRFHGLAQVTASPKELDHARQLLREHGETKAHFLLAYAQQAAPDTHYCPRTFMGILHYLSHALAAYDARATQATHVRTQQALVSERCWHERYLAWQQAQCTQLRAALSSADLVALEDAQRSRLIAAGTPGLALDFAVRVGVDDALAAQADLPTYEVWRRQQEEGDAREPT
jgi:hypothetical protein